MTHSIDTVSFPQRLRQETAGPHTALEELPLSKAIINPGVTREEYITYLSLMHDVVKSAEENIFPALATLVPDLALRMKSALIQKDLICLNADLQKQKDVFKGTPVSPGFAMGILYVIEGSSLGGRVILKNIQKVLGYDADHGAGYFSGYGENTGPYWKAFAATLAAFEEKEGNAEEIINGANFAFNTISKHFTENGPISL